MEVTTGISKIFLLKYNFNEQERVDGIYLMFIQTRFIFIKQ